MSLPNDLREFIELLNSRKVEYIIVGAFALAFHGRPRYTGDIDFLVRPSAANGARLVQVLEDFGFGEIGLSSKDFTASAEVIQLGHPPNRIDILTSLSGVDFDEAWESRVDSELDGIPVSFIGREAFIKNKVSTGRSQDKADLESLGHDQ